VERQNRIKPKAFEENYGSPARRVPGWPDRSRRWSSSPVLHGIEFGVWVAFMSARTRRMVGCWLGGLSLGGEGPAADMLTQRCSTNVRHHRLGSPGSLGRRADRSRGEALRVQCWSLYRWRPLPTGRWATRSASAAH